MLIGHARHNRKRKISTNKSGIPASPGSFTAQTLLFWQAAQALQIVRAKPPAGCSTQISLAGISRQQPPKYPKPSNDKSKSRPSNLNHHKCSISIGTRGGFEGNWGVKIRGERWYRRWIIKLDCEGCIGSRSDHDKYSLSNNRIWFHPPTLVGLKERYLIKKTKPLHKCPFCAAF